MHMVPAIRNILGGFLFSGDDIYKKCGVLSGGERTRLAVARMLLRPSNLLLLDEPTNHLDLDSKDVLLDALVDYGGTLIFVSHDRYFVERLATRIIEIGGGRAESFPGTYPEFLWRKEHLQRANRCTGARARGRTAPAAGGGASGSRRPTSTQARLRRSARPGPPRKPTTSSGSANRPNSGRRERERKQRQARVADLETRIAAHEKAIKDPRSRDVRAGFYDDRDAAQQAVSTHQALMWEVGELMHQWEMLAELAERPGGGDA